MNTRLTERFDLLRVAIGLFVVVGIALTAVAGYALLGTLGVTVTTSLAVAVLSGVSLLAFAVALTVWLNRGTKGRKRRRTA